MVEAQHASVAETWLNSGRSKYNKMKGPASDEGDLRSQPPDPSDLEDEQAHQAKPAPAQCRSGKHPYWKQVRHKVTGEEKWVAWWDVACRYGRDCARHSKNETCPFHHDSQSAEWEVVAFYWG